MRFPRTPPEGIDDRTWFRSATCHKVPAALYERWRALLRFQNVRVGDRLLELIEADFGHHWNDEFEAQFRQDFGLEPPEEP